VVFVNQWIIFQETGYEDSVNLNKRSAFCKPIKLKGGGRNI